MVESKHVQIFGVATSFAWEIVESLNRLNIIVSSIDNLGGADRNLPNLVNDVCLNTPIILGPASPAARNKCAALAFEIGNLKLATIVDPTAVVARSAELSHGVFVNASATIGSNSVIQCRELISAGFHGICSFSVMKGTDGCWQIIEINSRFTGSTAGRVLLGIDEVAKTLNIFFGRELVSPLPAQLKVWDQIHRSARDLIPGMK